VVVSQFVLGGGCNVRSYDRHQIGKWSCTLPVVLVVESLDQCGFSNMPSTKWHGLVGSSTLFDFFFFFLLTTITRLTGEKRPFCVSFYCFLRMGYAMVIMPTGKLCRLHLFFVTPQQFSRICKYHVALLRCIDIKLATEYPLKLLFLFEK
jgi:hypothetical protein